MSHIKDMSRQEIDPELDFSSLRRVEGWVNKKGGAVNNSAIGRRNWKKRWFVLRYAPVKGRSNYTLSYYDQPNGSLKGTVELLGTEVYCDPSRRGKRAKHEFQILLNTGNTLYMSCDNLRERDEWIETLNIVLFRLRSGAGTSPALYGLLQGYDQLLEDREEVYAAGEEVAQLVRAFGPGLFGAEAGRPAQFVLQMYDRDGAPVSLGGLNFTATLMDDECLFHVRVIDNDNGTYSAHYVIARPSTYVLNIRLNDEHDIFGSPFHVEVVPSQTVAEKCTCHGDCLTTGFIANRTNTFTLVSRDAFGNQKSKGGDVFELGVMGAAALRGLEDHGDGSYTCSIDAMNPIEMDQITSASLMVSVTLYGKHVAGSPFRPIIVAGSPSKNSTANKSLSASQFQQQQSMSSTGGSNIPRPASNNNISSLGRSPSPPPGELGVLRRSSVAVGVTMPPPPGPPDSTSSMPAPAPSISAQSLGPTSASRLEAARMRAMNGLNNSASSQSIDVGANNGGMSASRTGLGAPATPLNQQQQQAPKSVDLASRLSKLEQLTRQVGAGGAATAAVSSSRRIASTPAGAIGANSPSSPEIYGGGRGAGGAMGRLVSQHQSPTGASDGFDQMAFIDALSRGIQGTTPQQASDEEKRLLAVTHETLRNRDVLKMLGGGAIGLRNVYSYYCDVREDGMPLGSTQAARGFTKLLEDFGVLPSYGSKRDVKTIFNLVLSTEMGGRLASLGMVDFLGCVKALVAIAVFALSNPPFASLYQTHKSKAEVLMFKWGLADDAKLRTIQAKVAAAASSARGSASTGTPAGRSGQK